MLILTSVNKSWLNTYKIVINDMIVYYSKNKVEIDLLIKIRQKP